MPSTANATLYLGSTLISSGGGGEEPWTDPLPVNWERHSDWLALPTVGPTEEKCVALYGVYDTPHMGYISVVAEGNYTVDWGDGSSAQNFTSGTVAYKLITYASLGAGTVSSRGYRQGIITVTPQAGHNLTRLELGPLFGVSGYDTGTRRSLMFLDTLLGSPNLVTFFCRDQWQLEQVVIRSQAITNMTEMFRNCIGLARVEIETTVYLAGTGISAPALSLTFTDCNALQEIIFDLNFDAHTGSYNAWRAFNNCYSLRALPMFDATKSRSLMTFVGCRTITVIPAYTLAMEVTRTIVNVNNCWNLERILVNFQTDIPIAIGQDFVSNCYKLRALPDFTLYTYERESSPNLFSAFLECRSLKELPPADRIDFSGVTSLSFGGCRSIKNVPAYNLSEVTSIPNMFRDCHSLETIGINFSLMTSLTGITQAAFKNCHSLVQLPTTLTTSYSTSAIEMFMGCYKITSIPPTYTFPSATSTSYMFHECWSLKSIPALSFNAATNISYMFMGCIALEEAPITATANKTSSGVAYVFGNCQNLRRTGSINIAGNTSNFTFHYGTGDAPRRLERCGFYGGTRSVNYTNAKLSRDELVTIFNNLGTAAASQTITITGNPGVADLTAGDRSIVTGKGYTLVEV